MTSSSLQKQLHKSRLYDIQFTLDTQVGSMTFSSLWKQLHTSRLYDIQFTPETITHK